MEIRDMMWIYAVVILLVSGAWCQDPAPSLSGTNQTFENAKTVYVVRNLTFHQGSEVNLTCRHKTWSEMIFVVWHIELQNKKCLIGFKSDSRTDDTCNDGKSLRNTSSTQSNLHIPKISAKDVGLYKCVTSYRGGSTTYAIHVSLIVPPSVSAWLEDSGDTEVAVCKAERGKPAANITWSHPGKLLSEESVDSDGFVTVESRLEFLKETDAENVTCVIRHPYWKEERIYSPKSGEGSWLGWPWVLTGLVIVVVLAGIAFLVQKKLITSWLCHQSTNSPSKQPQIEDVEEVEPYASYVQRVNSIYHSSADLFT